jgi:hypothetical protein
VFLRQCKTWFKFKLCHHFFVFHYTNGDQEDLSIFLYEPIGSCMGNDENLKGLLKEKSVFGMLSYHLFFVYGKIGDLQ